MRIFIFCILMMFSFTLFSVNDIDFKQKISTAKTHEEKESLYLEWVNQLSQTNSLYCDTIIRDKDSYLKIISENGKLTLLILDVINSQFRGLDTLSDFQKYHLNKSDSLLASYFLGSLTGKKISQNEFKLLNKKDITYTKPTRETMYMIIAAHLKGIDKDQRVKYYKSALIHAKRSDIKSLPCLIFNLFSNYYLYQLDFKRSIQKQQKGLAYSEQEGLIANQIMFLSSVGHMHFELGDIERAEAFFLKALDLSSGLKVDYILGKLYSHLGQLYSEKTDLDKSIHYYQKSLLKFYPINNFSGLAMVHNNIGKAYYKRGDMDLAERNYQLSKELYKQIKSTRTIGNLYYNMAELYSSRGNLQLAENYINNAISIYRKGKLLIKLNEAYFLYAKIKNSEGDNKNAYLYLERYTNFQDSLQNQKFKESIAQLSQLFESEQKEEKITEQGKIIERGLAERLLVSNKLENTKKQNRLILVILIVSLSLFVAIFFIIRIRGKQERLRKKQREMELQQALLRVQMNPHFIFNAMVAIQSYIYDEDVASSSKFLIHISKLMRLILESSTKEFIPLTIELEIIDRYLVLQKMRFEDRFDFKVNVDKIDDPSRILIPPMLLQPFIENAIEHGGLDQIKDGLISIYCEIFDDLCIFTVEDNGVGVMATLSKHKSKTIKNHQSMASKLTKERIELLNQKYDKKGYLLFEDLSNEGSRGTRVTVVTPFRENY